MVFTCQTGAGRTLPCARPLSFISRGTSVSFSARVHAVLLPGHHLCFIYRGNKPANSPKGQPPDADGHSSVTDLANSLTGDMVMVRPSVPPDQSYNGSSKGATQVINISFKPAALRSLINILVAEGPIASMTAPTASVGMFLTFE